MFQRTATSIISMTANVAPTMPPTHSTGNRGVIAKVTNWIIASINPMIPPDRLDFQRRYTTGMSTIPSPRYKTPNNAKITGSMVAICPMKVMPANEAGNALAAMSTAPPAMLNIPKIMNKTAAAVIAAFLPYGHHGGNGGGCGAPYGGG